MAGNKKGKVEIYARSDPSIIPFLMNEVEKGTSYRDLRNMMDEQYGIKLDHSSLHRTIERLKAKEKAIALHDGVDIDEKLAAKFPLPDHPGYWRPVRRSDGTAVRP